MTFLGHENPRSEGSPIAEPFAAEKSVFVVILLAAFALRIAVAGFWPNIHHPDELFQYLEQGHRLAFGYGVVPWEFLDGARSWLLPGFLGALMWATAWLGGGPSAYMAVIAAVLSAFSLCIVVAAFLWAKRLAGPMAALLAGAFTATWFELVYFASKPLTEAVATGTLFWGAYLLCSCDRPSPRALFYGGVLLGLTFALRMHLAPAILVVAAAGCRMAFRQRWRPVVVGGASVVLAAGLLDWATWDYPFQSFWVNFTFNLIAGQSSRFGTLPWYGYLGLYNLVWSDFAVPMIILALVGARRAPLLLIVPAVIVASHSMIARKVYRFVIPALPFIVTLAAIGTARAVEFTRKAWPAIQGRYLVAGAVVVWAGISTILGFGGYFRPNLFNQSAEIAAFAGLRETGSGCAVGLVNVKWWETGGYTYLHRDIPIYLVEDPAQLPAMHAAFDTVLAPSDEHLQSFGYRRQDCYARQGASDHPAPEVCLFVRDGGCDSRPELTINSVLLRARQ